MTHKNSFSGWGGLQYIQLSLIVLWKELRFIFHSALFLSLRPRRKFRKNSPTVTTALGGQFIPYVFESNLGRKWKVLWLRCPRETWPLGFLLDSRICLCISLSFLAVSSPLGSFVRATVIIVIVMTYTVSFSPRQFLEAKFARPKQSWLESSEVA